MWGMTRTDVHSKSLTMTRFYLRLALLPLALFSTVLLLIHAQPYDDHELRQLLLPEGCPAPCFMGIRPGVTKTSEMLQILKASGWVDKIEEGDFGDFYGGIDWNGKQPLIWQINAPEVEIYANRDFPNGKVKAFLVSSTLSLSSFWITFGKPYWSLNGYGFKGIRYAIWSPNYPCIAIFELPYRPNVNDILDAKITMYFTSNDFNYSHASAWSFGFNNSESDRYISPALGDFISGKTHANLK